MVGMRSIASIVTLALLVPVCTLNVLIGRMHASNPDAPLGRAISRGLTPIALGLFLASAWILARSVNHDWGGYLITLITVVLVMRTSLNPLWLIAAGAVAGMAGLV